MNKDYTIEQYGHGVAIKLSKNTAELWDNGVTVKVVTGWDAYTKLADEALALAESRMGH